MTLKSQQAENLLRATLVALLAEPIKLSLSVKRYQNAAYFTVVPAQNDFGKVLGKGRTHLRAFEFLLYKLGKQNGEIYGINVAELDRDAPRVLSPAVKGRTFEECPALPVLIDWLNALGIGATGSVETFKRAGYARQEWKIVVKPGTATIRSDLIQPDLDDPQARTLVGSLGTLFRAIGNNHGVSISLEVADA